MDLLHPHAQGKSRNTRFRKRVLLPEEETLLLAVGESDAMLWAMWTAKEAAYKAIQKDQWDITSIPRRYKVQFDPAGEQAVSLLRGERRLLGTVDTPRGSINLETLITDRYVHSIATSGSPVADAGIVWQVERLPGEEPSPAYASYYVRAAAKRHLARYLPGGSPRQIEIRRAQGPRGLCPPVVYLREEAAAIDISLSH
ncbi:MAG: 4'-phosphopantetheinyl transferase superfamily protein, partial [Syntrophales bacterium LBB04]|nr:4'-phosphopantetheinyl transferase superfamily protein [Syntrophales bacterium LBB04]